MNVPSYLSADILAVLTLPISLLIYLLLVWDKHTRPESSGDDQLGVKTVSATLALIGIAMLAEGLHSTLDVLLQWGEIKATLKHSVPDLLVGALTSVFVWKVYIPRTNHKDFPKSMRLTAGAVAVVAGVVAVKSLDQLLSAMIALEWKDWAGGGGMASSFLALAIAGGLGAGGLVILSKLSGVKTDDLTDGAMRMAQQAASRVQQGIADARAEPGGMPQQPAAQQYQQPAAQQYQQPVAQPQQPAQPYQQPQQPAPGGFQQPQQPAPGGFQQPQQPAPGGFQQPGGFQPGGGPPKPGGFNR